MVLGGFRSFLLLLLTNGVYVDMYVCIKGIFLFLAKSIFIFFLFQKKDVNQTPITNHDHSVRASRSTRQNFSQLCIYVKLYVSCAAPSEIEVKQFKLKTFLRLLFVYKLMYIVMVKYSKIQ